MGTLPQRASVAALGVALVLAAATAGAAAPDGQRARAAASITCDSKGGGGHTWYDGPSASAAYDRRFGPGPALPGLATYTPQGVAPWFNWSGPNKDLLVVTEYRTGANAHLVGIDPQTGRHVGTVAIAPTHAGGIAITMGWAFVQGTGNTIRKYRLSQLRSKMTQGGTPYLEQIGKARKVHSADFLSSYANDVYAGRFSDTGRGEMYRYIAAADGSLATQPGAYEVPKKTQGLLVTQDRFVYSTSFGNDNRSNLYVVAGGARVINPSTARCFRAPSMAEGIAEYGGNAYLVFESGAAQYVSKHPRNRIDRLHKATIAALTG